MSALLWFQWTIIIWCFVSLETQSDHWQCCLLLCRQTFRANMKQVLMHTSIPKPIRQHHRCMLMALYPDPALPTLPSELFYLDRYAPCLYRYSWYSRYIDASAISNISEDPPSRNNVLDHELTRIEEWVCCSSWECDVIKSVLQQIVSSTSSEYSEPHATDAKVSQQSFALCNLCPGLPSDTPLQCWYSIR